MTSGNRLAPAVPADQSDDGDAYPWYQAVEGAGLEQGDLLVDFPLLVLQPPFEKVTSGETPDAIVRILNVVILSQSCDLSAGKVENVLVCPYYKPDESSPKVKELKDKGGLKMIKQGRVPSLHILPPCELEGFVSPLRVANFREVAAVPFGLVEVHAAAHTQRVRLLPPYREHLAQAFGRFVMRVGLPREFSVD